jgi:Peroxisomal membrane protein (Pex16)
MLNIMSMYHDTLLARIVRSSPKYKPLIPSSLHTRYTRAWSDKDNRYKWAARILELLRFTELVIEMALRRRVSAKNRWRGLVLLEALKCVQVIACMLSLMLIISGLSYVFSWYESRGGRCYRLRFLNGILILVYYLFLQTLPLQRSHHLHHLVPHLLPQNISRITIFLLIPTPSLHQAQPHNQARQLRITYFRKLSLLLP